MKINFSLLLLITFFSCQKVSVLPDNLICTESFDTVTVNKIGEAFDSFYTLENNTGERIIVEDYDTTDLIYPVLNDRFVARLRNKQEVFTFVGILETSELREEFVFTSDGCHIMKVSGPNTID